MRSTAYFVDSPVQAPGIRRIPVLILLIGTLALPRLGLALSFPISVQNYSGKTLIVANEDYDNLIAVPILNNGLPDAANGVALADSVNSPGTFGNSNPDDVVVTADGRFAYTREDIPFGDFYGFDLQNVEFHGSSHITSYDFSSFPGTFLEEGLVRVGNFLYAPVIPMCDPCSETCPVYLAGMSIDPTTGALGTPAVVTEITDGVNTATGIHVRLTTDGTCIYAADTAENDYYSCNGFPPYDTGSKLVYQICDLTAMSPTVSVWADTANGGDAPDLQDSDHFTLVFGPQNQNLFLSEYGAVFSTTGPSGMTPGAFSYLGDLPNPGNNEGSALLMLNGIDRLLVGDDFNDNMYSIILGSSGASVTLGTASVIDGETGNEQGLPGDLTEFDSPGGMAIIDGSPRFSDGTYMFSTAKLDTAPVVGRPGLLACGLLLLALGAISVGRRRAAR